MEQEIWKDIPGYIGLYQVSSFGNIKSVKRNKILRIAIDKHGYKLVALYKNKKIKMSFVHRLIAMAFIPNPENKPEIDHIDGNRLNNNISNLRWATHKENCANPNTSFKCSHKISKENREIISKYHKGRWIGGKSPKAKAIIQMAKDGTVINKWDSISEAARTLNFGRTNINKCLCGKTQYAMGYKWIYQD